MAAAPGGWGSSGPMLSVMPVSPLPVPFRKLGGNSKDVEIRRLAAATQRNFEELENQIRQGFNPPQTGYVASSFGEYTSTTLAEIWPMTFDVLPETMYRFEYHIIYYTQATTTGIRLAMTGPTPSYIFNAQMRIPNSGTDGTDLLWEGTINASGGYVESTGGLGASRNIAIIEGSIKTMGGGKLKVLFATEVAGSYVVISSGTNGMLHKL